MHQRKAAIGALICAAAALFGLGALQAQEAPASTAEGKSSLTAGRYQLVKGAERDFVVFDTATGQLLTVDDLKTITVTDPVRGVVLAGGLRTRVALPTKAAVISFVKKVIAEGDMEGLRACLSERALREVDAHFDTWVEEVRKDLKEKTEEELLRYRFLRGPHGWCLDET